MRKYKDHTIKEWKRKRYKGVNCIYRRFYHKRYYTDVQKKELDADMHWYCMVYPDCRVYRNYYWHGRMKVVTSYPEEIHYVNKRRPKRVKKSKAQAIVET